MNKKIFENARFTPKGDYEANWKKATGFIPLAKEIIIYKAEEGKPAKIKIGDGVTGINDLPFVGTDMTEVNKLINEKGELLIDYINEEIIRLDEKTKDCPRTEKCWKEIVNGTYTTYNVNGVFYGAEVTYNEELDNFEKVNVIFDGIEYKDLILTYQEDISSVCVGNLSILNSIIGTDYKNSIEPFVIVFNDENCMLVTSDYSQSSTHSLIISYEVENLKKLDNKYLSIDKYHNANSENAQSGLAVNQAIYNSLKEVNENFDILLNTEQNITAIVFDIEFSPTSKTFPNDIGITSIDWGDGTKDNSLTHTYTKVGSYICKVYGATSLTRDYPYGRLLKIGNSVLTIEPYTFDASGLYTGGNIIIPDSVTTIADYAFFGCSSLTSVVIGDSVTSIGKYAFYNCWNLMSVMIGDSVTSIGEEAFAKCSSLTSITIPDSVTSIAAWAFQRCDSLTTVEIGDNVTSISHMMFLFCTNLTSIVIGAGTTYISAAAFQGCTNLTSVTFKNYTPVIYDGSGSYKNRFWFKDCNTLPMIYVPYGCSEVYKTQWAANGAIQDLLNKIIECDKEVITATQDWVIQYIRDGKLDIEGGLTLPNSPTTPDKATVTDTYVSRQTAKSNETGLTVVDSSMAAIKTMTGSTTVCRNLFDPSIRTEQSFGNSHNSTVRTFVPNSLYVGVAANNWYNPALGIKIKKWSFENGFLSVTAVEEAYGIGFNFDCQGNEQYSIQFCDTNSGVCKVAFYSDGQWLSSVVVTNKGSITTPENCNQFVVIFCSPASNAQCTFYNIQIEKGAIATEYQPYFTGLKSTCFKGVESTGVNLFDPNRTIYPDDTWLSPDMKRDLSKPYLFRAASANGYLGTETEWMSLQYTNGILSFITKDGAYGIGFNLPCIPNQEYTVSFKNLGDTIPVTRFGFFRNDGVCLGHRERVTTATAIPGCDQMMIVFTTDTPATVKITDIQVQVGSAATEYVPYVKPYTYTFPETLIPVGRTIDFEQKKIIDYGVTLTLTGEEGWTPFLYSEAQNDWAAYAPILPNTEANNMTGIVTDGFVSGNIHQPGCWQIGHGSQMLWLHKAFEYYGFDSSWVDKANPTIEEKEEAIGKLKAYFAERYASGNPVMIHYVASELQQITDFSEEQVVAGNQYAVYHNGMETLLGDIALVVPQVTQEYHIHENPMEAPNKAYVNNSLAKKLDKTGGEVSGSLVIRGDLTVEGVTTTLDTQNLLVKDSTIIANADGSILLDNAGFVIRTNTVDSYGIMYDPVGDGVKIGLGKVDEVGKFDYNEGEAQFLATRSDTIVGGNLVQWDDTKKTLVDSQEKIGDYAKIEYVNNLIAQLQAQIDALKTSTESLTTSVDTLSTSVGEEAESTDISSVFEEEEA